MRPPAGMMTKMNLRVLIADTLRGSESLVRIMQGNLCTVVSTLRAGRVQLAAQQFDLIVVGLHFDGSHMYEFMQAVKQDPLNSDRPIVCYCSRDSPLSRERQDYVEYTSRIYGASVYLDERNYSGCADPDAELRLAIQSCLTKGVR